MLSEGKDSKDSVKFQLEDLLESGSEKALVAALAEAYVQGVSTRKMAKVTEQLVGKEFSASPISRFSEQMNAELEACRSRRLMQDYPYIKIDTRYERAVSSRRDNRRYGGLGCHRDVRKGTGTCWAWRPVGANPRPSGAGLSAGSKSSMRIGLPDADI